MFAFDRSAVAVLAPLAILVAVVFWSNLHYSSAEIHAAVPEDQGQELDSDHAVAANLPSR
jgi:hypothetical protein